MGKFDNSVQALQRDEGRQRVIAILERATLLYLSETFVMNDRVICSREQLERLGVDANVFELVFPQWKTVEVSESGTLVRF